MKTIEWEGKIFLVGESQMENDELVRTSQKDWLWFHLDGISSCHVVLQDSLSGLDRKVKTKYFKRGCLLTKQFTKKIIQHQPHQVIWSRIGDLVLTEVPGQVQTEKYSVMTI